MTRTRRGKSIRFIATSLIGLALIGAVLSRLSFSELGETISRASLPLLLAAAALTAGTTVMRGVRYASMLTPGGSWPRLYATFAFMRVLNTALPLKTGEIASLALLKRNRLSPSIAETAPAWTLLRICDVGALGLLAGGTVLLIPAGSDSAASLRLASLALMAIAGVLFAGALALPRLAPGLARRAPGGWLGERLSAFADGLARIRDPRVILRTLALSLPIWLGLTLGGACLQHAFGTPLEVGPSLLVAILVLVASIAPVHAPLAIGTGEVVWLSTMVLVGLEAEMAMTLAVAIRLVILLLLLLEGAIGFALLSVLPASPAPEDTE